MDNGIRRPGRTRFMTASDSCGKKTHADVVSPEAIASRLTAWLPMRISTLRFIDLSVDRRNLGDPTSPLAMLHIHDFRAAPVKVIGDEGYLLVQLIEGVA